MRFLRSIGVLVLLTVALSAPGASAAPGNGSASLAPCWPKWRAVPSPRRQVIFPGTAISASSATDAWLVGGTFRGPGLDKDLIEHWDGDRWSVTVAGRGDGYMRDVAAVSTDLAWAVGATDAYGYGRAQILGWDGLRWHRVPTTPVGTHSELKGVDALGPDEAGRWDGSPRAAR
jgi:hypothetical protein